MTCKKQRKNAAKRKYVSLSTSFKVKKKNKKQKTKIRDIKEKWSQQNKGTNRGSGLAAATFYVNTVPYGEGER